MIYWKAVDRSIPWFSGHSGRFINRDPVIKTLRTAVALTVAASLCATASASAAPPVGLVNDNLKLDSRDSAPAATDKNLVKGTSYRVRVKGVVSFYGQSLWNNPAGSYRVTCGATQSIAFASPRVGGGNDVGGVDAEFLFAGIAKKGCGKFAPPYVDNKFQINLGSGFFNPVPSSGQGNYNPAAHTYSYDVVGQGKLAQFELIDQERRDNSGRLDITVTRL